MRLRKWIRVVVVFIVIMLLCMNVVRAIEDNTIGTETTANTTKKGGYNGIVGVRVAVFESNGNNLVSGTHVADIISLRNAQNLNTRYVTVSQATKVQYKNNDKELSFTDNKKTGYNAKVAYTSVKKSVNFMSDNYVYGAIDPYNFGDYTGHYKSLSGGLSGYLKQSDYVRLKAIVSKTGYECLENTQLDYCDGSQYIVVEPMFQRGSYILTGYEATNLYSFNTTYEEYGTIYKSTVRTMSLKNDVMGLSECKNISSITSTRSYNELNNINSGCGIGIYKVSDIVEIDTDNETPINKTCQSEFDALPEADKADRKKRIEFYNNHPEYKKYTNLLNLKEVSNPCSEATCDLSNSNSGLCLSARYSSSKFNEDDLSCYTNIIDVSGNPGYCLTTFNLDPSDTYSPNGDIESGQLYFNVSEGKIMTGNFKQMCYFVDDMSGHSESEKIKNGLISDYLSNAKLGGKTLTLNDTEIELKRVSNYGYSYVNNSLIYTIPKVFVDKEGKELSESCDTCSFIGYGILSKFAENENEKTLDFSLSFNKKISEGEIDKIEYTGGCTVFSNRKFVCDPSDTNCATDNSNKLNFEFRIIDTSNPFPGKNAINNTGRLVGENWCTPSIENINEMKNLDTTRALRLASGVIPIEQEDYENYDIDNNGIIDFIDFNGIQDSILGISRCNANNGNVRMFIKEKPNSYGVYPDKPNKKSDPKYRITLDASKIQAIRDYNKTNSYDDFDKLECQDGNNCISSFLTTFGFVNRDNLES